MEWGGTGANALRLIALCRLGVVCVLSFVG